MVRRVVFLVFALLPGQLASNSVPLTRHSTSRSVAKDGEVNLNDLNARVDVEDEEQEEEEEDESESDGDQPRIKVELPYKPMPFRNPCDGGEIDFGPDPNEGILDGLSQHMQVALEQTCTNVLLGCTYRQKDFNFAGDALIGLFKDAVGPKPDGYWDKFRTQLHKGFEKIHDAGFGLKAEDDAECPHNMKKPEVRAKSIEAVQNAWKAHFVGFKVTLPEVWKKMEDSKFDFMVALADQIADDHDGKYADMLQHQLMQM